MIYTLTLNPAIDYVMHTDALSVGEISRAENTLIYFGGKGINVSLILKELGVGSTALGFIGGFTGQALESFVKSKGIKTDFVTLENGSTRINVKIRHGVETDINASGDNVTENDIKSLLCKLEQIKENDLLVISGSAPKGIDKAFYQKIAQTATEKGARLVADASGEWLTSLLSYKPFLIKPNADELGEIFGTKIATYDDALKHARSLKAEGAQNVLVSMGEKGAVLLDQNNTEHTAEAKTGNVKNTVGAGDSMLAGFLAGYLKSGDLSYALNLGIAAGSATAFSEGLATGEEILELF